MKTFVVNRTYGKYGSDFLHDWCDQWGTACMLSIDKAMKFQSFDDAQEAANKAQKECKGFDGKTAKGITFKVKEIL